MDFLNIFIIIGIAVLGYLVWRLTEQMKKPQEDQAMKMLQEHLFKIQEGLKNQDKSLNEQSSKLKDTLNESLHKQFAATSKMVKDMVDSSKSVSEQLTKLGRAAAQAASAV